MFYVFMFYVFYRSDTVYVFYVYTAFTDLKRPESTLYRTLLLPHLLLFISLKTAPIGPAPKHKHKIIINLAEPETAMSLVLYVLFIYFFSLKPGLKALCL